MTILKKVWKFIAPTMVVVGCFWFITVLWDGGRYLITRNPDDLIRFHSSLCLYCDTGERSTQAIQDEVDRAVAEDVMRRLDAAESPEEYCSTFAEWDKDLDLSEDIMRKAYSYCMVNARKFFEIKAQIDAIDAISASTTPNSQ